MARSVSYSQRRDKAFIKVHTLRGFRFPIMQCLIFPDDWGKYLSRYIGNEIRLRRTKSCLRQDDIPAGR
jgi:hypothetical protein